MAEPGSGLLETLRSLLRALKELRADYMLVGGIALAAWIPPRATTDIDLLVTAEGAPQLAARTAAKLGGVASMRAIRFKSGLKLHRILVPSASGEVIVDLLLADGDFHRAALGRRIAVELPGIGRVQVATAEDLLLLKLAAGRPQDKLDIAQLLAHARIDLRYVETQARRQRLLARWHRLRR